MGGSFYDCNYPHPFCCRNASRAEKGPWRAKRQPRGRLQRCCRNFRLLDELNPASALGRGAEVIATRRAKCRSAAPVPGDRRFQFEFDFFDFRWT